MVAGLLRRFWGRARRRSWVRHDDHNEHNSGHAPRERREDDERIKRLREEVKRYEQDLRELADA
jgi:hypothetical protein